MVGKICTKKDRFAAWRQTKDQYTGLVKWKATRDEAKSLLETTKYHYYGTGKYIIESHITFQKNQSAKIECCSSHVNATYCNDKSKISILLKMIDYNDQCLMTQMKTVCEDTKYTQDYNKASNFLMAACQVKKRKANSKEQVCSKSQVAAINIKSGIGKTRVDELRWYPRNKLKKFTKVQKERCEGCSRTEHNKAIFEAQKKLFLEIEEEILEEAKDLE